MQPRQLLADRERDLRQRALVPAGADHRLDVGAGFCLRHGQERRRPDRADEPLVRVHDGKSCQRSARQPLHDLGPWRDGGNRGHRSGHPADCLGEPCNRKVLQRDRARESSLVVDDEHVSVQRTPPFPESRQGFADCGAGVHCDDSRVHETPGAVVGIGGQSPKFPSGGGLHEIDVAIARRRVHPAQHRHGASGIHRRQNAGGHAVRQTGEHARGDVRRDVIEDPRGLSGGRRL